MNKMSTTKKLLMAVLLGALSLFLMGSKSDCNGSEQQSMSGATQVTGGFTVPKNVKGNTTEQQNILDRNKVLTDPTSVLFIHLIALDGKIINRMPVRCKVTSSGKRLEPTVAVDANGNYPNAGVGGYETNEFIQPDGTYGYSDSYIYWFDPLGRYHQWGTAGGLGYLLTNYPIDLRNPQDEITGLYNMSQAAYLWQQQEEAKLRKQEGK